MMHRAGFFLLARLLCAALSVIAVQAQADMQPLDSEEMSTTYGFDGVSFEWDLQINTLKGTGNPAAICTSPTDKTQCRLALRFSNRPNEWLVFKNFSGRLFFPRFDLNATTFPSSPTPVADASRFGASSPYNRPGLRITFPEAIEIWNYRIGGMAVEYGTGLTAGTGFRADPTDAKSFIGLAINNSISGMPAKLDWQGDLYIFGF